MYKALAGAEFRLEGTKFIIIESNIPGSDDRENTSMDEKSGRGVYQDPVNKISSTLTGPTYI